MWLWCCRVLLPHQVFTGRYEFVSREQEAALLQDISLQVMRLPPAPVCAQHSTASALLCGSCSKHAEQRKACTSQPENSGLCGAHFSVDGVGRRPTHALTLLSCCPLCGRCALQELQSFYATYLAPSSPGRRKLCVQVIPAHKPPPSAGGVEGGAQPEEAAPPEDHVQHEFGVVHPGGEHHAKPSTASRKEDGRPETKRARRQQQQQQQEDDSQPQQSVPKSVQVARVQAVSDVKAFAAAAEHYGVYQTVQPQLAVQ